jgi:hypothetical protein
MHIVQQVLIYASLKSLPRDAPPKREQFSVAFREAQYETGKARGRIIAGVAGAVIARVPPRRVRIIVVGARRICPRCSVKLRATRQIAQNPLYNRAGRVRKPDFPQDFRSPPRLHRSGVWIPRIRFKRVAETAVRVLVVRKGIQNRRLTAALKMILKAGDVQRAGVAIEKRFGVFVGFDVNFAAYPLFPV